MDTSLILFESDRTHDRRVILPFRICEMGASEMYGWGEPYSRNPPPPPFPYGLLET